jgi:hypothetical protein
LVTRHHVGNLKKANQGAIKTSKLNECESYLNTKWVTLDWIIIQAECSYATNFGSTQNWLQSVHEKLALKKPCDVFSSIHYQSKN